MSRLFIIGAGFSKGIANAPLANGFIKAIWEKSLSEDDKYKHSGDWPNDRAAFIKLLTYFHDTVQNLIDWLGVPSGFARFLFDRNSCSIFSPFRHFPNEFLGRRTR